MLLGLGLVMAIVVQALFNISVVLSLVPTKGIPLPFISYGGSSLVPTLMAMGILLNISQQSTSNGGGSGFGDPTGIETGKGRQTATTPSSSPRSPIALSLCQV